ncbi:MAG: DUF4432 family protein [Verrucomicrobia bacterium]|jgi:hypothetical protein|nr:DUF4432 family protein [Verrucomicrobiota bacterium]
MKPLFTTTFLDTDNRRRLEDVFFDASMLPACPESGWSVRTTTLRGGLQEGVDVVEIDNGKLSFAVLPTRGMGILKAESGGTRFGWDSPVKDPVHPAFINLQERGGLGWLKGFNEWIVRCGLSSMGAPGPDVMVDNNGNPSEEFLNLHGRIANTPARKVGLEITPEEMILRGEVEETMLFGPSLRLTTEIRTAFGTGALTINDTVTNIGNQPCEHQLLYHVNYGKPLLEKGARFLAPLKKMAPRDARAAEGCKRFDRYGAPTAGFVEQVYFMELAAKPRSRETLAMLRNAAGNLASVLRFSIRDFPCFSLWKNTAAVEDGYVTGFEPGTAYPNARQFERGQGRVIELPGGASRSTSLTMETLDTRKAVQTVEKEIRDLQKRATPKLHSQPIPKFSGP